jgi:hypothetical protein
LPSSSPASVNTCAHASRGHKQQHTAHRSHPHQQQSKNQHTQQHASRGHRHTLHSDVGQGAASVCAPCIHMPCRYAACRASKPKHCWCVMMPAALWWCT